MFGLINTVLSNVPISPSLERTHLGVARLLIDWHICHFLRLLSCLTGGAWACIVSTETCGVTIRDCDSCVRVMGSNGKIKITPGV